MASAHMK